jgi:transposase-like protein
MKKKRTYRTKEFKFKVALAAIKGNKQIAEIAEEFKVHPNQVTLWKKELLEKGAEIFAKDDKKEKDDIKTERDFLYQKVGEQTIRIDWLKKNLGIED